MKTSAIVLAFFLSSFALFGFAKNEVNSEVTKTILEGPVRGSTEDGIDLFLGIPYAEPPVGRLRWMPPVAKKSWSQTFIADKFGPQCGQTNSLGTFGGPLSSNEDCLSLNVFAPHDASTSTKPRPVLIWLHGGGNFMGASEPYNPSALVKKGLVVVTLNYRLGVLGWFAHPALDSEGHDFANYGLMDQQLALRWVAKNISKFGGDAGNVTLAGQSAGSLDTQAQIVSPKAKGLFHRAIWQSGVSEPVKLDEGEATGKEFAAAAGCNQKASKDIAKCLRALSSEQVLKLQGPENKFFLGEGQVADGKILPRIGIHESFARGEFNKVPVLSSSTLNEWNFVAALQHYSKGAKAKALEKEDYDAFIRSLSKGNKTIESEIAKAYPLDSFPNVQEAISAIGTDSDPRFECSMRHRLKLIADKTEVYFYIFADKTAPSVLPVMEGHQSMADHTSDLQYLFVGFHGGPSGRKTALNPEQLKLSNQLIEAWVNFASQGNPNGKGSNYWPKFTGEPSVPAIIRFESPKLTKISDADLVKSFKCNEWQHWHDVK